MRLRVAPKDLDRQVGGFNYMNQHKYLALFLSPLLVTSTRSSWHRRCKRSRTCFTKATEKTTVYVGPSALQSIKETVNALQPRN